MTDRITVVISQGQSQNPARRDLEEQIVAGLLGEPGLDVAVIPHLYDLQPDSTGVVALQGSRGDLIVLSWLYPRATRWVLARHGVIGRSGTIGGQEPDEPPEGEEKGPVETNDHETTEDQNLPNRWIYCLDLRVHENADAFVNQIKQIVRKCRELRPVHDATATASRQEQRAATVPLTVVGTNGSTRSHHHPTSGDLLRVDEQPRRRWYPVIDYSRCTNCMECIDFCLFGVYGVDAQESILVEQPDNCRKGCPACSRVCPENAILFPQHAAPAIAGAPGSASDFKLDLSGLFGGPSQDNSAQDLAEKERAYHLEAAGRSSAEATRGSASKRHTAVQGPKDKLDELIDSLDELDL